MSRRNKARKGKDKIVINEKIDISEERLIEIYAEAYYRALKRLEQENVNIEKLEDKDEYKGKRLECVKAFINIVFSPWRISKKLKINDHIYDSILVIVISGVLCLVGILTWIAGLAFIGRIISIIKTEGIWIDGFIALPYGFVVMLLGSMLIIGGKEFYCEKDSNKIYAFSACIIALVSCILSFVMLIKG